MPFWNRARGKSLQEACKSSAIRSALVPEPNKQTSEDHVRKYEEICISLWDYVMIWAQPLHYWQGGGKLFTLRCEPFKSGGWCIPLWALNHASISLSRSREEQESGQGQEAVCVRRDQICSCDVWSHEPAAAAVPSESWGRSAEKHNSFITLSIHHLVSYGPDFFFFILHYFLWSVWTKSPLIFLFA